MTIIDLWIYYIGFDPLPKSLTTNLELNLMTYNTFDRFQGIWLGSIIGQALVDDRSSNTRVELSMDVTPNWLVTRKQVAQMLLEAEWSFEDLARKIVFLEEKIIDAPNNPWVITSERRQLDKLLVYGSHVLSLLPLIMFYGDDLNSFQKIIGKCYLK